MRTTRRAVGFAATMFVTGSAVLFGAIGAAWAVVQVAPVSAQAPTITGTAKVGETLTAQNGTWENNPTSIRFRWLRCDANGSACLPIPAESRTYKVAPADAGHRLRVRVTAANADGATTVRSEPTAVVQDSSAGVTNTSRPTITGEARVGQELTASEGSWAGNPTSFAFQWQRCDVDAFTCVAVPGSTGKSYGVRTADIGFRLRVEVTARNGDRSASANSLTTAPVQPTTPITNRRPTIRILSVRFTGARVYTRFRVCDDVARNLTILVTESRPGKRPAKRSYATRVPPRPCGAYTRSWVPAQRFRGPGRYTITLRARDTSGQTSSAARRTVRR